MTDEIDDALSDIDKQVSFGSRVAESIRDRAMRKLAQAARALSTRVDVLEGNDMQARNAIVDLRQRVKALEDKVFPPVPPA